MCLAPPRRTLFQHLNCQKWSEPLVFLTFWLRNVLRATPAYTFRHLVTWKCASRHNGVHFFNISTSKSGPKLRCFAHFDLEMCFAPQRRAIFYLSSGQLAPQTASCRPEPQIIGQVQCFATFLPFLCIFFLLTLSLLLFFLLIFLFSLPLPCSAFHLSILSEVWLLNFLR